MPEFEPTSGEGGLSMTQEAPASQESAPSADSSAPETPEAPEAPRQEVAPADDPEVTLPDGSKAKWSDVQRWKSGHMMQSDYTKKTTEVAELRRSLESERREFDRVRQAAEEGLRRVMEDPNEYARLRASRGLAGATIDPFTQAEQWIQARRQQYVQAGLEAEATPEQLRLDLMEHKLHLQNQRFEQIQQQAQETTRRAAEEQEALQLEKTLTTLMTKYKAADTPIGREMVEGFLAREINRGNESPDIESIVKRVAEIQSETLRQYAGKKADQARSVSGITRGRGQPRAPDKKDYGGEVSSFREMAEDRIRRG